MHYRMFVTTAQPTDALSEDVREAVLEDLAHDDSFSGQGGRFGAPVCDWFLIGGRWSGLLAETQLGNNFRDAVVAHFPELENNWNPHSLPEDSKSEIDRIWQSCGGTGMSPYTRGDSDMIGFPDDAQVITSQLYDALLTPYEGESICLDNGGCEFVDLDDEALAPDFIGSKWLVVIDYHN